MDICLMLLRKAIYSTGGEFMLRDGTLFLDLEIVGHKENRDSNAREDK